MSLAEQAEQQAKLAEQQAKLAAHPVTKVRDITCAKCGRPLAFVDQKERDKLPDGRYACRPGCPMQAPAAAPAAAPVAVVAPDASEDVAEALAQIAKWDEAERRENELRARRSNVRSVDQYAETRTKSTGWFELHDGLTKLGVFQDTVEDSAAWEAARDEPELDQMIGAFASLLDKLGTMSDGMVALMMPKTARTMRQEAQVAAAQKLAKNEVEYVGTGWHDGVRFGRSGQWGHKGTPAAGGYRASDGRWRPTIEEKDFDAHNALVNTRAIRIGLVLAGEKRGLSLLEALKAVEKEHHALWRMYLPDAIKHAGGERTLARELSTADGMSNQVLTISRHALAGGWHSNSYAKACGSRQHDDGADGADDLVPLRRAVNRAEKEFNNLSDARLALKSLVRVRGAKSRRN